MNQMFANLPQYGVQPPAATPDSALTAQDILSALERDGATAISVSVGEGETIIEGILNDEKRSYSVTPVGVFLQTEALA